MKDDVDRAEIAKANELIDGMSTFTEESLENAITHLKEIPEEVCGKCLRN